MDALLATHGLDAGAQFRAFQEAICKAVIRLDARRTGTGPYQAEIRTSAFGPFHLADVQCDPVVIERTREDIALDGGGWYFLALQIEGRGWARQRNREVVLQPGDFTLIDGAEPYLLGFDVPVKRLVLRVPREEIDRRLRRQADLRALSFGRSANGSTLAFDVLRGLASEQGLHRPEVKAQLGAEVLDLSVAAMLGQRGSLRDSSEARADRARNFVLERARDYTTAHLRDPTLHPAQVATAIGISVRYLHEVFHGAGQSFGQWVRNERLQRCHEEIADPSQAHRLISEIAFSYGFNETAHFSRVFARQFGYPPRALRARANAT
ncbi:MAG: helix-turn-helix domain-containing protein [Burkholderiaceae bacterium]|jgi:AraC-like DNA-binding protein|nr:helix-turn-helix domain-containing protein [Burkholderiaceae bacterium]